MEPYIRVEDLVKEYRGGKQLVFNLDIKECLMPKEGIVFIRGKSGAGKTTLLNMIGLLDAPTSGKVVIDGRDTGALGDAEKSRLRREFFGFVFQQGNLIPTLTVMENIMLALLPAGGADKEKRGYIDEILTRLGILGRQGHLPSQLSGGEQQRAAIARALVNRPRAILADEPTANLDPETSAAIINLLYDIALKDKLLLVITGDNIKAPDTRAFQEIRISQGILA